jgi:hypothetical protein
MRRFPFRTVAMVVFLVSAASSIRADDPPAPLTLTAQRDRQRMLDLLKIPSESMRRGPSGMNPKAPDYQNIDEAKLVFDTTKLHLPSLQ